MDVQPEPSNKCPQPPTQRSVAVSITSPVNCIHSVVRIDPIFREEKRARKSEEPHERAVSSPRRIPMVNYYDRN